MGKRERPERPDDYEEDELQADGPSPIHWALFALRSVRRRKALAAIVFAIGVSASIVYYLSRTPLYRVEASILAQRQQSLSTVRSGSDEAPTRSAWELVHRRENLLALIEQTHLYNPSAAPARPGLVARLRRLVSSAPVDDDPLNALVLQLSRKLQVKTSEGTVSISIDWSEPDQAYRIVKAALQNFLEARHLQEVTALDEVISLMQGRLATLGDQLDKAVAESRRQQASSLLSTSQEPSLRPSRPSASAVDAGDESGQLKLVQLKSMIEAKERAIADVEEFRRRRLADLQAQLDQTRGVYSEQHPAVINLRQDIEALSRESPQITALRDEERKLRQVFTARLAQESRAPGSTLRHQPLIGTPSAGANSQENERVREARMQYQQMLERVNAAQVELDAARAAFKYRYNVMWPAQVPKKPVSPNKVKILGLGPLAALVLAILAAAAADLRAGRIVERWQVEHGLDLPILAELDRKQI